MMKAQHLLVATTVSVAARLVAEAYLSPAGQGVRHRPAFAAQHQHGGRISNAPLLAASYDGAAAAEFDLDAARQSLEGILAENDGGNDRAYYLDRLAKAEAKHGMPWKSSIDTEVADDELLYMKFWEWQMNFMKDNLTSLRVEPCTNGDGTDFAYNENVAKKARIVNLCARSDEYRKIRMTYYDAGDNTQVFNAVWYPDPKYNLPVLGIDLLAFNRKKYLAIVDFQPLYTDESEHAVAFEDKLAPIKEQYDNLKGRMSSKFYDETQFFSQQMLFSRFENEAIIHDELFPAFQQYVQMHLELVRSTTPLTAADAATVLARHQAYDTYSAERDPATGLFCAMFGQDWALDFVHDFLFSMSVRPAGEPKIPVMPGMGGGPPPQQAAAAAASPKGPQSARREAVVGSRQR